MDADQRTARIFGLWFIGTFVFSIPAFFFYDPILNEADYILGDGSDARVAFGAFLEILLAIANIATAVVLYRIARRVHEAIAIGYVALRIIESAIIVIGLISLMSVVTLRQDLAGAGGDAESLDIVGQALVAFHEWTRLLGPQFCAAFGNGILLGYLMYKSRLVPPRMALIGLIGGPLAFLGGTLVLLGVFEASSPVPLLLTIPEIIWEASIALYCTFKGFRASSPYLTAAPAAPT